MVLVVPVAMVTSPVIGLALAVAPRMPPARLKELVWAALMRTVPLGLMVTVPAPPAEALLSLRMPALTVTPPLKEFAPERTRVPAPSLVRALAAPSPITPGIVRVLLLTVMMELELMVPAPVPRLRLWAEPT